MHPLALHDVWTVDDLDELDVEDWWRYEIVDGALVVTPTADGTHELASEDLRSLVRSALPDGLAIVGPLGVDIAPTYLVPDILVAERATVRRSKHMSASDVLLAIEIVSPGSTTMDRLVKPAKYAAAGIPHYWRVEQDPLSLTAYRLAGDTYAEIGTWQVGEVAELADPFPVRIDIAELAG